MPETRSIHRGCLRSGSLQAPLFRPEVPFPPRGCFVHFSTQPASILTMRRLPRFSFMTHATSASGRVHPSLHAFLPFARHGGYRDAPAIPHSLAKSAESIGGAIRRCRHPCGDRVQHFEHLERMVTIAQQRGLAEARRRGALLEPASRCPFPGSPEEQAHVDGADPLQCHGHGFADPPPRIGSVALQRREVPACSFRGEPSQAEHSAEHEVFLLRVGGSVRLVEVQVPSERVPRCPGRLRPEPVRCCPVVPEALSS